MAVSIVQAREAKTAVRAKFSKIGRVVGIGITRVKQDYAVKVNLHAAPASDVRIPKKVDGVPVLVEVVGDVSTV